MNTNYPHFEKPEMTVDLVIFTVNLEQLKVLLVKRAEQPFAGFWSIPGGFLKSTESLEDAAIRVMQEKTGVKEIYLEQLYTFGAPARDPRARVVTVAYFALIPWQDLPQPTSKKISDLGWHAVEQLPELAFDHREILDYATSRLRAKASYSNIVYGLLPAHFKLSELQKMYGCWPPVCSRRPAKRTASAPTARPCSTNSRNENSCCWISALFFATS